MTTADWTVIDDAEVLSTAYQAAHTVARQFEGYVEKDDVYQEALILCALNAERVREKLAGGWINELYHELKFDLIDLYKRPASKAARVSSLDALELDS